MTIAIMTLIIRLMTLIIIILVLMTYIIQIPFHEIHLLIVHLFCLASVDNRTKKPFVQKDRELG